MLFRSDLSRGATHWINGPDADAQSIGMKPLLSGLKTEDEGLFVVQHGYWKDALVAGLKKDAAAAIAMKTAAE